MANFDFSQILGGAQQIPFSPASPSVQPPQLTLMQQAAQPQQNIQAPPASPEELEVRKQGWREFINGVLNDPNAGQFLLDFGTSVLAPPTPGQSDVGRIASSFSSAQAARTGRERQALLERERLEDRASAKEQAELEGRKGEQEIKASQALEEQRRAAIPTEEERAKKLELTESQIDANIARAQASKAQATASRLKGQKERAPTEFDKVVTAVMNTQNISRDEAIIKVKEGFKTAETKQEFVGEVIKESIANAIRPLTAEELDSIRINASAAYDAINQPAEDAGVADELTFDTAKALPGMENMTQDQFNRIMADDKLRARLEALRQ